MNSAVEIMDTGFACLVEKLGIVDAERFVAMIETYPNPQQSWGESCTLVAINGVPE